MEPLAMALFTAASYADWLTKSSSQKVWLCPPCTALVQVVQSMLAQTAGQGPPQSIPASPWLRIPSLQVGHTAGQGPPQSIDVSPWFWIPSLQVGSISFKLLAQDANINTKPNINPGNIFILIIIVLETIVSGRLGAPAFRRSLSLCGPSLAILVPRYQ